MRALKLLFFLSIASAVLPTTPSRAQIGEVDVDGLTLHALSQRETRLVWTPVPPKVCEYKVVYDVFRSSSKGFQPSDSNRIASGITVPYYTAHEPNVRAWFYRVRAVPVPVHCVPSIPGEPVNFKSGKITTSPLDLGNHYNVMVGDVPDICTAASTSELACGLLQDFHAVIAAQDEHEYLIGCPSRDFDTHNWTCVDLGSGSFDVIVHSRALAIKGDKFSKIEPGTGKEIEVLHPEFSILSILK